MVATRTEIRYLTHGVWIEPDALGGQFWWPLDDGRIRLRLPMHADDFAYDDEPETPVFPAWERTAVIHGSGAAVNVRVLLVEVTGTTDRPISAADKLEAVRHRDEGNAAPVEAFSAEVSRVYERASTVAEAFVARWLRHLRTSLTQPWLGLSITGPRQHGRGRVFDDDAGVQLMAFGPQQSMTIRSGQVALGREGLARIATAVGRDEDPAIAEELLADALFLVREADPADPSRAVISAAVALEIKTKSTLRAKAPPEAREALERELAKRQSPTRFLDEPALAAIGTSLRIDDADLHQRAVELVAIRNRVVHEGATVEFPVALRAVVAARQVFEWLDDIEAPATDDSE